MTLERIVGAWLLIVTTAAAAAAQPPGGTTVQPSQASSIREIVYSSGAVMTSREVRTRTASDRGDVVVDAIELPGPDGRMRRVQETMSETLRTGPGISRTQQHVFGFDGQGRPTLLVRTESEQNVSTRGDTSSVTGAWIADLNDRLVLTSKLIGTTVSVAPDTRHSVTTVLRPSANEPLRESERTERTEHRIAGDGVRVESAELTRDLNGRWQSLETRHHLSRRIGPREQIEEDTVQRPDVSGNLRASERTVTRRSERDGRGEVVVETFTPEAAGSARSDGGLGLSRRTRTFTASTADGEHSTVEEVEARNPVAMGDPMRVVQRVVTTVRGVSPNRRIIQRQVFELDVNNRLTLVLTESEDTLEK